MEMSWELIDPTRSHIQRAMIDPQVFFFGVRSVRSFVGPTVGRISWKVVFSRGPKPNPARFLLKVTTPAMILREFKGEVTHIYIYGIKSFDCNSNGLGKTTKKHITHLWFFGKMDGMSSG